MSGKKKVALVFCTVLLVAFVSIGYLSINYIYQEFKLREEIVSLSKLDIKTDDFNTEIVTIGDYAKVETAIKDYMDSYADSYKNVNSISTDETFKNLLTLNNFANDTDFVNSINYVNETKESFNKDIDNLITKGKKESIEENINKLELSSYYTDMYNELMVKNKLSSKLNISEEYLENYRNNVNSKLDACIAIYNYLNSIKDEWTISEDGTIKFHLADQANVYNGYVNTIKGNQ